MSSVFFGISNTGWFLPKFTTILGNSMYFILSKTQNIHSFFMSFPGLNWVFLRVGTYMISPVLGFRAAGFALVSLTSKTRKPRISIRLPAITASRVKRGQTLNCELIFSIFLTVVLHFLSWT